MILLKAEPIVNEMRLIHQKRVTEFKAQGIEPCLAVILIGNDPASEIYVARKIQEAQLLGVKSICVRFDSSVSVNEVKNRIDELNLDHLVHGILIQRPLPKQFVERDFIYWVDPLKDVDAFHPVNVGLTQLGYDGMKSCTPMGILKLLNYYSIDCQSKNICVVGRSNIVGKPVAQLLTHLNATVTLVHSHTKDLSSITSQADIVIVACGKAKLLSSKYFKKNAVVIDVGIHRDSNGKLCGDVDFESVQSHVAAISPVPGGVGPMTIQMLFANLILAVSLQNKEHKR